MKTEDKTPVNPLVSFTGWIRRGRGAWKLFCRAATDRACWDELLAKVPTGVDKLVKQGDADPNNEK